MSSTIQAIATIALGIWFCKQFGTIGIAWASLIPNVLISVVVIFPVAFKKLNIGFSDLFAIYGKPFFAALVAGVFCFGIEKSFGQTSWSIFALIIAYFLSGLVYLGAGWVIMLSRDERKYIAGVLASRLFGKS
jgi:hypothetical protein